MCMSRRKMFAELSRNQSSNKVRFEKFKSISWDVHPLRKDELIKKLRNINDFWLKTSIID